MHSYHLIPIKNKSDWFKENRVFYFQLGKSKKVESFLDQNYAAIELKAKQLGLTFIYHKYLSENLQVLSQQLPDYEFLTKAGTMNELQFYDELQYLIFDYNVLEPVYIVRRLDEDNLIAWLFLGNNQDLAFPFEALQPLEKIAIGENCPFNLNANPKIHDNYSTTHPSTHPEAFFSARYQCTVCKNGSTIFISNDYSLFNISDADLPCSNCNQENGNISSGDLIYRKDWRNPDDDPWQTQCAYISEGTGHCLDCHPQSNMDYKDLRPSCSNCNEEMIYEFLAIRNSPSKRKYRN